ncbi:hypothetical protein [Streptomyces sp. NRRL S-241]|uniref:hypothetical protein n=1 Tax=Streptomyces sp. NRRL S-241 TaxID=1463896 RepID=UPI0004C2A8E6|nr:hypothetical protein [Streptomyces sp. NRRL S-241]
MSVRVFRHVHQERSHRTLGGVAEPPAAEAARWDAMLEAVAISRGLPADRGQVLYEAWVTAEQPPECSCTSCSAVRGALETERAREAAGAYRGENGFWIFPNGLPDGEEHASYQVAEGVWVHVDEAEPAPAGAGVRNDASAPARK